MKIIKKLSLQVKLFFAFLTIALFVIFVGTASFISGRQIVGEYQKIALKNLPASVAAANLRGLSKDVRSTMYRLGTSDLSDEELDNISTRLKDLLTQYEDASKEYLALPFVEGEQELFQSSSEKWTALAKSVEKSIDARLKKTPEGLQEYNVLLKGEVKENNSAFSDAINDLVVFQQAQATKSREQAEHMEVFGNRASILLIVFGFLIALCIGYFFGRALTRSLLGLSSRLSDGACNVENTVFEIGKMSESLASQNQQQAAALQETSSAVVEITETVSRSADGAQKSEKFSKASQEDVLSGQESIINLVEGLEDLKTGNQNLFQQIAVTTERMDSLVKIIRDIETKTKVINEIVFQTKLLSFNASVEAARAGEYGKGFAVVAEEVGSLARMSGTASQEIAKMLLESIESVNQIANESKSAMQQTMAETSRSLETLQERISNSKEIFERIDGSTSEVVQQMGLISHATKEQNVGMQEISKAIGQLESTMNTNSAISESAASTATELRSEVESLKFVIRDLLQTVHGEQTHLESSAEEIQGKLVNLQKNIKNSKNDHIEETKTA